MKRIVSRVLLVAGLVAATAVPAQAQPLYYASGPAEQFRGYTVPVLVIPAGTEVVYLNGDIASHDVVADNLYGPYTPECALAGYPTNRCPIFWTPLIGIAQTSPIYGISTVAPGTYPFKCTIHAAMRGLLVVVG